MFGAALTGDFGGIRDRVARTLPAIHQNATQTPISIAATTGLLRGRFIDAGHNLFGTDLRDLLADAPLPSSPSSPSVLPLG